MFQNRDLGYKKLCQGFLGTKRQVQVFLLLFHNTREIYKILL